MSESSRIQRGPIRRVGYVGLGIMGGAMAANLARAGFDLTVWNRTPARCEPLAALGAAVADSAAATAASGVEVVCVNVSDTPDVEAVLFGSTGIAEGAREGLVVVDHSTISPDGTRRFAERLAAQGVTLVDAPVSGGDVGARNATLSIMVGGPDEAVARLRPLFEAMGRTITHLGPVGSGQVCKACNQIAVSVNLMGVCEAMALARRSGLDLAKMIDVLSGGAAGSWQLANLGPKIASGDLAPGFSIDLVLKDLAIISEAARSLDLPLAGTELARSYFQAVANEGGGGLGTQGMSRAMETLGRFRF